MGEKKIQNHRKVAPKPAFNFIGFHEKHVFDVLYVHERAGIDDHEADIVLTPAARPSRHLVKRRCGKGTEFVPVELIRIEEKHGTCREINAGSYRRSCKDRVEVSFFHHRLDDEFPCGELAPVVGAHPVADKTLELIMLPQKWEKRKKCFKVAFK